MLSRVANSIYWLGRYVERAENVARFIEVNLQLALDHPDDSEEQWSPLVTTTGDHEAFAERFGEATRENVLRFLTFDVENPNSILSCVRAARENARSVREALSSEIWMQINTFYLRVTDPLAPDRARTAPHEFYSEIKTASHLIAGVAWATMTRDQAWHFWRVGTWIERADKTTRILDVKYFLLLPSMDDVGSPHDDVQWAAVLQSASGLEQYRRRYGVISPINVVRFLLLDVEFPRAAMYCLTQAEISLHEITGAGREAFRNTAEQRLGQLRSELAYTKAEEIIAVGLHEYLDTLQGKLNRVGDAIYETFFAFKPIADGKAGDADATRAASNRALGSWSNPSGLGTRIGDAPRETGSSRAGFGETAASPPFSQGQSTG
jgi:uncharacterized alpha-E superfamily protein